MLSAILVLVVNLVTWVAIPYYLGTLLAGAGSSTPLAVPAFVYEFGVIITALVVLSILAEGNPVWVPLTMATGLVVAYYLWAVTDGGVLSIVEGQTTVTLEFRLILYVILVPTLWSVVRSPVSYLLYRRQPSGPPARGPASA